MHEPQRPRIAFFTAFDLGDIAAWSWSGTFRNMMSALQTHCGDVTYIGPITCPEQRIERALGKATRTVLKKNYPVHHSSLLSRAYGRIGAERLARERFDIVVAPAGETEIAYLNTSIPIVMTGDATYGQLIDYYPDYSHLLRHSVADLHRLERLALTRVSAAIYSTEWAARSAIDDYGADPQKVHVASFGPGFASPKADVLERRSRSDRCRLLFIGMNWQRKGGAIAVDALKHLHQLGVPAELYLVGCTPPDGVADEHLHVIPFLDQRDPQQRAELEALYLTSDYLILPTRNECSPLVFCEANAYGLPVISTDTGGVSGLVTNGKNGYVLPLEATGSAYAELIAGLYRDEIQYAALVRSSRAEFEDRLNWDAWGKSVNRILESLPAVVRVSAVAPSS